MKNLKTIGIFLAVFAASVATAQKTVIIQGKVTGETKGYNQIYYYGSGIDRDSVTINNGQFKLTRPFTETVTILFYTQYEIMGRGTGARGSYRPFPLLIDGPGTINLDMNIEKGFWGATITGMQTAALFNSFLLQQSEASKKIGDGIMKLYGKAWAPETDPLSAKINKSRDSLSKIHMTNMVMDFVKQNKDKFVGVYVLNGSGKSSLTIEQLESTLNSLPGKMQKTPEGEKLVAYIRGVKNSGIGKTVKNFTLNNEKGKPVSFEQFKGKYVWVDFWATWCGPCKMSFPRMREIYAQLKGKNFEILGISTDTKIEPWLKYLETNMNPWPQVWDSKNIMSEFAVTAFPTSFLIGPDGVILVKEIGFDPNAKGEIVKKLEEVFGPLNIVFEKPKVEVKEGSKDGAKIIQGTPMMKIK